MAAINDVVRYVLNAGPNAGQSRPCIVTAVDGTNIDCAVLVKPEDYSCGDIVGFVSWRVTVPQGNSSTQGSWY